MSIKIIEGRNISAKRNPSFPFLAVAIISKSSNSFMIDTKPSRQVGDRLLQELSAP